MLDTARNAVFIIAQSALAFRRLLLLANFFSSCVRYFDTALAIPVGSFRHWASTNLLNILRAIPQSHHNRSLGVASFSEPSIFC
jgi:hypothetical protein